LQSAESWIKINSTSNGFPYSCEFLFTSIIICCYCLQKNGSPYFKHQVYDAHLFKGRRWAFFVSVGFFTNRMKQAYNNSQIACARHTRVQKRRSSGASQHDVNTAAYLLLWENVCAPGHKTHGRSAAAAASAFHLCVRTRT
jgi:hypothetical protein